MSESESSSSLPNPYGTDKMDALMFAFLVFIDSQNEDQECMQTLSTTLEYISQAGSDCSDAGTEILDSDNEDVQKADYDNGDESKAQSTMQYDTTRINNETQQFTTLQESIESEEDQLATSAENETEFMKSFLDVYTNMSNIIASGY
jgi:hypothetical protein